LVLQAKVAGVSDEEILLKFGERCEKNCPKFSQALKMEISVESRFNA